MCKILLWISLASLILITSCQDSKEPPFSEESCATETIEYNDSLFRAPRPAFGGYDIYDPPPATRYDQPEFRARVVELMMAGYGREYSDEYRFGRYDFRMRKYPFLRELSQFSADTDFVFLTYYPHGAKDTNGTMTPYWWDTGGPKQSFHAGYVKSIDEVYLLSEGFGPKIDDVFRHMHSESGGHPRLHPICKTALLIRLKYTGGLHTAVVYNHEDLDAWTNRLWLGLGDLPSEWLKQNSVVVFNPSTDSVYMSYVDSLSADIRRKSAFPKDREIVQPSVVRKGDSTVVTLTTQAVRFGEQIITWQVGFDDSDSLLFIRTVGEPFEGY